MDAEQYIKHHFGCCARPNECSQEGRCKVREAFELELMSGKKTDQNWLMLRMRLDHERAARGAVQTVEPKRHHELGEIARRYALKRKPSRDLGRQR